MVRYTIVRFGGDAIKHIAWFLGLLCKTSNYIVMGKPTLSVILKEGSCKPRDQFSITMYDTFS